MESSGQAKAEAKVGAMGFVPKASLTIIHTVRSVVRNGNGVAILQGLSGILQS